MGGVAALSWELLWQIESSLALGVSALGTAITLAATMAGMTVGSYVCGRMLRGRTLAAPERVYGRLEAVIGLSGLAMPAGFIVLELLDARIWRLSPTLAPVLHCAGIALLLGPPTLAMGATVPVFELLARSYRTSLSRLYGINVAGAALGVILLAFVLLPALGVRYTVALVAALNLLVFAAMHILRGGEVLPGPGPGAGPARAHAHTIAPRTAAAIVFCTGFVTFGLEVAWFRSLRAAYQSSADSFAIILASVLIPLAIGARLVPRVRRSGLAPGTLLAGAAVAILLATPLVERMDLWATMLPDPGTGAASYPLEQGLRLLLALVILGPPILLLGIVLPWLLDEFAEPARAGGRCCRRSASRAAPGCWVPSSCSPGWSTGRPARA